jgi:glucosylceramidase
MFNSIKMKILVLVTLTAAVLNFNDRSLAASVTPGKVTVFVTAEATGQRLAKAAEMEFVEQVKTDERQPTVYVDPGKTFQTFLGIGGALTDASAETFYRLPKDKQREFLDAYYDREKGIGYSLGRTHIHSCDFSSESYTYVEDGDAELKSFNIQHDLKYRVPFIKEVLQTAGPDFTLYASPWSPPAWMKSNNNMLHGGSLKPEFADAWARYFVKFINAYEKEGIPIWGLTVQNEPLAVQTWESCIFTGAEERDFLKNHLGPVLEKAGLRDKKIIIWDHNRNLLYQRAQAVLDDPEAAKYVWGVGLHWYVGDHFDNVKRVQEAYPNIHLLFTEGCHGPYDAAHLQDWQWGELYAKSMIQDFNNGVVGWTDWNVLLDERGGPNHVRNFCFAPIHTSANAKDLVYMNSYYYIGHFSKFVLPGAKRIISASTSDDLLTTAFLNPNGDIATIVLNSTEKSSPLLLQVKDEAAKVECPAHSIITFVFRQPTQAAASQSQSRAAR